MLVTSIFSFSHGVFKGFFFRVVKSRDCLVKSNSTKKIILKGSFNNISTDSVNFHIFSLYITLFIVNIVNIFWITLSQTRAGLTCLQYKSFENTVGKGEIARNEQFLLFPQCFLPIWRTFCYFLQTLNCHLQTLSIWKGIK